tara:strand:+ start:2024 stop:2128 length:105 start_codon:yes stop_codon:yes gene_type:complete
LEEAQAAGLTVLPELVELVAKVLLAAAVAAAVLV